MTTARTVPAGIDAGGDGLRRRGRGIVATFAITQTIGYGTLYYAFAVFLTPMAADLHASTTAVTGAFTASILAGALLAVPIGRWLDRHGGRALMTAGSLAGTLLLIAWANVDTLGQLYLVQIGIGIAATASLYEAAMAVIVTWFPGDRRSGAILAVTIVAGFASSIFLPLTGWLTSAHGWRTTLLILAGIQALTVPLHAWAIRSPPSIAASPDNTTAVRAAVRTALGDPTFWLLAIGFTANMAAISAMTVHLVAALISWGHPASFAATIAGLLGVLSVTGRLVTTGLQRRFRAAPVTAAVFALQGAAAIALAFVGATTLGAIGAVIGFGLGFGVATIARPVLMAERYDVRQYATLAGILLVPMTLAKAAAPLAAAALLSSTRSYGGVLVGIAVCCTVAAAAIAAAARTPAHLSLRCRRLRSGSIPQAGSAGSDVTGSKTTTWRTPERSR
jgi:predicted MFS family arabinose efflux permease